MALKPHIKLNSKEQKEKTVTISFNYGFGGDDEDEIQEESDYSVIVDTFRRSLFRFNADIEKRRVERNEALQIPAHIDFIQILFQDQFNIRNFYQNWYNDFGLLGVNFSNFNHEVLFAVIDQNKFSSFLGDIRNFILKESREDDHVKYREKIKFIKNFRLLTTVNILNYEDRAALMNFRLIEFPGGSEEAIAIRDRLFTYLEQNGNEYRFVEDSNVLEIYSASQELIEEIAKNFDVLLSVTSSLSTVVRPSELNIVERTYGFEISNAEEDLPIIGILDTGISNTTPLSSILIEDDSYNLTNSNVFIDSTDHGTAVGALAALGRYPYSIDYRGDIPACSKLLSMKILDANSGYVSEREVLDLLHRAKQKYPSIKLFVLTIGYKSEKKTNENYSSYAFMLDKFSHENNCLIFISTTNNNQAFTQPDYDLNYFSQEITNICSPAESMNNITVGAAADNLSNSAFVGISNGREFPALYTRKSNIDLTRFKKPNKRFTKDNPHLFKPDVIECGGDYEISPFGIGTGENAVMQVLSSDPSVSFYKYAGTSFSTPLVANIAAQIQKKYPTLRVQTIKALILNAASLDAIPFTKPLIKLQNKTAGHGIVDPVKSKSSSDNAITFVVEDEIKPEEMKVIPLNFPIYLTEEDLGKESGLLKLSATLCFSFDPVLNNHLGYCPIQMAFAIFRNHTSDQITQKESDLKSKLKNGWSQNNRWKSKPVPASNTQKIEFTISVKDLQNENSTFKLAVHCLINPQLLSDDKYKTNHPFSMAITIEENLPETRQTAKLYSEMIAINKVENIIHSTVEVEGDIELLN